jgi:hypothetical protein
MEKEIIGSYDFAEDAMGLGDFVTGNMAQLPDDEIVVYVTDGEGNHAKYAVFVRETLTDGSTVVNLVIQFDRD